MSAPSSLSPEKFSYIDYMQKYGYKKVVICNDSDIGLKLIIAIHSTALGPATGGLRMWPYANDNEALLDALRLARGMTYKYAAAGVNLGGGKAVLVGNPKTDKSEALFRAVGRMIDQLGGEYITGEDVGTTLDDMELIYTETDHVVTLPEHAGGAGDISLATALGSVEAMRACAEKAWGDGSLDGRKVALQGLGMVGMKALKMLVEEGAEVVVSDVDAAKVKEAVSRFGVASVEPDAIYGQPVDIFAPFALGGVINDATIAQLKAKIVAGSANNILEDIAHGSELDRRGIIYAVDFVANSGGTIYDTDRFRKGGFQPDRAMKNVKGIRERTREILALAQRDGVTAQVAAERIAEARIAQINYVRLLNRPEVMSHLRR